MHAQQTPSAESWKHGESSQEWNFWQLLKTAMRAANACFNPGLTSLRWTRLGGALVICLSALGSNYLSEPPCIQPHICQPFTVISRDGLDVDVSQQVVKYDSHFICCGQLFWSCILHLLFRVDLCEPLIWIIASPEQSLKDDNFQLKWKKTAKTFILSLIVTLL